MTTYKDEIDDPDIRAAFNEFSYYLRDPETRELEHDESALRAAFVLVSRAVPDDCFAPEDSGAAVTKSYAVSRLAADIEAAEQNGLTPEEVEQNVAKPKLQALLNYFNY